MPSSSHLNWTEVREFGGLWTAGANSLMPANRAQIMSGCHPQPGGGLRAFLKVSQTISGASMDNATNDVPAGFGAFPKALPSGVSKPTFYMVTVDEGVTPLADWQLWHWEQDAGVAAWTRIAAASFAGATSSDSHPPPGQPSFVRMDAVDAGSSLRDYLGISIREAAGTASGLYWLNPEDGAATRNATYDDGFGVTQVTEHQGRLVVAVQNVVAFSAPSNDDFTGVVTGTGGAGFVVVNPSGWATPGLTSIHDGAIVAWMVSVPPGDLVVATRDGRIYSIQGDLADPIVRELGRWAGNLPHRAVNTPRGIFFILPGQGVARLGLDGSVEIVSQDLLPAIWQPRAPKVGLGMLAGTERFVFAPNGHQSSGHTNGALVFDTETGAWFTSTHSDDFTITKPLFMTTDNNARDSGLWVVSQHSPGTVGLAEPLLFQYRIGGYDSASLSTEARGSTYEWKGAPLRDPSGRQVRIREVHLDTYAFNAATSTVAVTVGGTTITRTLPAGRSIERFLFKVTGEDLDVKVKAKSNDAAVEAPITEAVRIGWQSGHNLR